ncbi:hypothetical protein K456DRAFT_142165 [Colletotrichum gloeosporioides 23]|nr:hypothetical protein K456DRAFT_142165 [Colletotrichum gloeosporioides 23]
MLVKGWWVGSFYVTLTTQSASLLSVYGRARQLLPAFCGQAAQRCVYTARSCVTRPELTPLPNLFCECASLPSWGKPWSSLPVPRCQYCATLRQDHTCVGAASRITPTNPAIMSAAAAARITHRMHKKQILKLRPSPKPLSGIRKKQTG